jgi:hypothetical protein
VSILVTILIKEDEDKGPYLGHLQTVGDEVVLTLTLMRHEDATEVAEQIVLRGAVIGVPDASDLQRAGIVLGSLSEDLPQVH